VIQHIVIVKWKPGTTEEQVLEACANASGRHAFVGAGAELALGFTGGVSVPAEYVRELPGQTTQFAALGRGSAGRASRGAERCRRRAERSDEPVGGDDEHLVSDVLEAVAARDAEDGDGAAPAPAWGYCPANPRSRIAGKSPDSAWWARSSSQRSMPRAIRADSLWSMP